MSDIIVTEADWKSAADNLRSKPIGLMMDPGSLLLLEKGFCVSCADNVGRFVDDLSLREFKVSGLCQSCQDSVFAESSTDPEVVSDLADRQGARA